MFIVRGSRRGGVDQEGERAFRIHGFDSLCYGALVEWRRTPWDTVRRLAGFENGTPPQCKHGKCFQKTPNGKEEYYTSDFPAPSPLLPPRHHYTFRLSRGKLPFHSPGYHQKQLFQSAKVNARCDAMMSSHPRRVLAVQRGHTCSLSGSLECRQL
jgi:hypothetical protein